MGTAATAPLFPGYDLANIVSHLVLAPTDHPPKFQSSVRVHIFPPKITGSSGRGIQSGSWTLVFGPECGLRAAKTMETETACLSTKTTNQRKKKKIVILERERHRERKI